MSFGQLAADVEAKPGAGNATKRRLVGPVEPVKDSLPLVLGNAGTLIGDPSHRPIALPPDRDEWIQSPRAPCTPNRPEGFDVCHVFNSVAIAVEVAYEPLGPARGLKTPYGRGSMIATQVFVASH
jgi:hypothetical protein